MRVVSIWCVVVASNAHSCSQRESKAVDGAKPMRLSINPNTFPSYFYTYLYVLLLICYCSLNVTASISTIRSRCGLAGGSVSSWGRPRSPVLTILLSLTADSPVAFWSRCCQYQVYLHTAVLLP